MSRAIIPVGLQGKVSGIDEVVLQSLPLAPEPTREILTEAQMRAFEAENLRVALRSARGKVYGPGGAAAILGLRPTTLLSRLKTLERVMNRRANNRGVSRAMRSLDSRFWPRKHRKPLEIHG
jgi:hypothetical protein